MYRLYRDCIHSSKFRCLLRSYRTPCFEPGNGARWNAGMSRIIAAVDGAI